MEIPISLRPTKKKKKNEQGSDVICVTDTEKKSLSKVILKIL